jgi:DNA-binding NarL/FixJ family response regulator
MIRRIYIVWVHPLFCDTVRLLLTHPSIEIVGLSNDYDTATEEVAKHKPDTIIIEDFEESAVTQIKTSEIMNLFPEAERIIRLSLKDNELWIYRHKHQSINNIEDFLSIIRDS